MIRMFVLLPLLLVPAAQAQVEVQVEMPASAQSNRPDPVASEYLYTRVAQFEVTGGADRGISYVVSFDVIKHFPGTVHVLLSFEDPEHPDAPIFIRQTLPAGATKIEAKSERMRAIKNGRKHRVEVRLYEDAAHRKLLGSHEQFVYFEVPASLLKQLGIRVL